MAEVYIDDILVESKRWENHCANLQQAFDLLQHFGKKLNPAKCAFGISIGKFLGFLVTEWGIEIDPSQIKGVQELLSPHNKKEVQRLIGKMVVITHFISWYTDRLKPFFNMIKKAKTFEWTTECEEAFLAIKSYLISPSILKSPQPGDLLYMYPVASKLVVSVVLFKLGSDGSQLPVSYVSNVMLLTEQSYTLPKKVVLALWVASKKLRPYFQAHQVNVLTNVPLGATLHRP